MKPEVWGPHAWIFLHSITLDYPDNPNITDKQNMINFINSLGKVLPCQKCRNGFEKHLLTYPLDDNALANKNNLVKWMIDIHNCVNDTKKCKKLSYDEAFSNIIEHYQDHEKNTNKFIIILIIVLILIILLSLYMFFQ